MSTSKLEREYAADLWRRLCLEPTRSTIPHLIATAAHCLLEVNRKRTAVVSIVGDKLPVLEWLVQQGRLLQSIWAECERDPSAKAKQKVQAAEDEYLAAHAELAKVSGQSMTAEEREARLTRQSLLPRSRRELGEAIGRRHPALLIALPPHPHPPRLPVTTTSSASFSNSPPTDPPGSKKTVIQEQTKGHEGESRTHRGDKGREQGRAVHIFFFLFACFLFGSCGVHSIDGQMIAHWRARPYIVEPEVPLYRCSDCGEYP
jgi:hypothetical protein